MKAKYIGRIVLLCISAVACGESSDGSPPEAVLNIPSYVDIGGSATLDASASTDPDNDIAFYRFIIADGTEAITVSTDTITHVFLVEGLIGVDLEVIDLKGNSAYTSKVISVRRP